MHNPAADPLPWTSESERLVIQAAQDDPTVFGPLYEHYRDPVYRYLRSRAETTEEAEDLLNADDDPGFARLVAELDTLGKGSVSPRGDLMIQRALAVHVRELAQQTRSRPLQVGGARQRRWTRHPRARLGVAVAASVVVLLSVGTYLHGQSPTTVSAQTVLHSAAAASPGPNEATHATYRVSSSDGSAGTADVWIGYDGSGAATQLALTLTMSQDGHPAPRLSVSLVEVGPRLLQVYHPGAGPAQMPVPAAPGAAPAPGQALATAPYAPGQALKGIVVGTLLAQKLSNQLGAYKLQQETLDGVPVYALQPEGAGGVTYYFNAQSYVLQGADWVQDGNSWQARLDSYSTVPLSAVPANTFGSGRDAGGPRDEQRIRVVDPGSAPATQQG